MLFWLFWPTILKRMGGKQESKFKAYYEEEVVCHSCGHCLYLTRYVLFHVQFVVKVCDLEPSQFCLSSYGWCEHEVGLGVVKLRDCVKDYVESAWNWTAIDSSSICKTTVCADFPIWTINQSHLFCWQCKIHHTVAHWANRQLCERDD